MEELVAELGAAFLCAEIGITVEDPETLEGKWTIRRETVLSVNDELQEYLCADNNRYLGRQLGR